MEVVFIEIELYQSSGSDSKTKIALRADDITIIREMANGTRIVMREGKIFDTALPYEEVKELITKSGKL